MHVLFCLHLGLSPCLFCSNFQCYWRNNELNLVTPSTLEKKKSTSDFEKRDKIMKVLCGRFFEGRIRLRWLLHDKLKLDIQCFFLKRILCICVELIELSFLFCGRRDPSTAQEYTGGLWTCSFYHAMLSNMSLYQPTFFFLQNKPSIHALKGFYAVKSE